MMKLRKGVSPDELKKYNFKMNYDHSCYEWHGEQYTLFVYRKHDDDFIFHKIYMEKLDRELIIDDFDILSKLITDRIVE